eukprot:tig00020723_g13460.t1
MEEQQNPGLAIANEKAPEHAKVPDAAPAAGKPAAAGPAAAGSTTETVNPSADPATLGLVSGVAQEFEHATVAKAAIGQGAPVALYVTADAECANSSIALKLVADIDVLKLPLSVGTWCRTFSPAVDAAADALADLGYKCLVVDCDITGKHPSKDNAYLIFHELGYEAEMGVPTLLFYPSEVPAGADGKPDVLHLSLQSKGYAECQLAPLETTPEGALVDVEDAADKIVSFALTGVQFEAPTDLEGLAVEGAEGAEGAGPAPTFETGALEADVDVPSDGTGEEQTAVVDEDVSALAVEDAAEPAEVEATAVADAAPPADADSAIAAEVPSEAPPSEAPAEAAAAEEAAAEAPVLVDASPFPPADLVVGTAAEPPAEPEPEPEQAPAPEEAAPVEAAAAPEEEEYDPAELETADEDLLACDFRCRSGAEAEEGGWGAGGEVEACGAEALPLYEAADDALPDAALAIAGGDF